LGLDKRPKLFMVTKGHGGAANKGSSSKKNRKKKKKKKKKKNEKLNFDVYRGSDVTKGPKNACSG